MSYPFDDEYDGVEEAFVEWLEDRLRLLELAEAKRQGAQEAREAV